MPDFERPGLLSKHRLKQPYVKINQTSVAKKKDALFTH